MVRIKFYGEPEGIRTPDPRLRRPVLYPTELLTHNSNARYIIMRKNTFVNGLNKISKNIEIF